MEENLGKLMNTVKALATAVLGESDGNSTPGVPTPHGGFTGPRKPAPRRARRSSYIRGQPQPYRPNNSRRNRNQLQRTGSGIRPQDSFSLSTARGSVANSSVASGLTVGTALPHGGVARSPFARPTGRGGLALPSLVANNPNTSGSMRLPRRRSRASVASDDEA